MGDSMSEFGQPHIVWYAIIPELSQIREYIAILKVLFSNYYKGSQNMFIKTSKIAIEQQISLNVAKIFDSAYFGKNETCSLYLLKMLCLKDSGKFPEKEQDQLIVKIDDICKKYNSMALKKLRDKMLAHYDLEAAFTHSFSKIDFEELEALVEDYSTLISAIGERLLGITMKFPAITELEQSYIDSLKDLVSR